jgi:hypothetical protein
VPTRSQERQREVKNNNETCQPISRGNEMLHDQRFDGKIIHAIGLTDDEEQTSSSCRCLTERRFAAELAWSRPLARPHRPSSRGRVAQKVVAASRAAERGRSRDQSGREPDDVHIPKVLD